MLSREHLDYIVTLRDWTEFWVTKEQYWDILFTKQDNPFYYPIIIKDVITWKLLYWWEVWDIKKFREINKEKRTNWEYICDFWYKHTFNSKTYCKCLKNNEISPIWIVQSLRYLWYKINYQNQIKEYMMIKFEKFKKENSNWKEILKIYANEIRKKLHPNKERFK